MKRSLLLIIISIAVTLTAVFSLRASIDALAVVIGVVLGVAASVPTTFLITYLLIRPRAVADVVHPNPGLSQPPVVVINTQDKPAFSSPSTLPALASPTQSRKWNLIGDSDTE